MSDPIPLDPDEGPTAWVMLEEKPDHAEQYNVRLVTGTEPQDPVDEILLNQREALKMCRTIQSMVDDN